MENYTINYLTTALEDWVTAFYFRLKIQHPRQINIDYIARKREIFLHRKKMPAFHEIHGRYQGITIDCRASVEQQREMFFHELCHILRHSGIQSMMPTAFRELQEQDAMHFTLYAAIPAHMIKYIDLDDQNVVDQMVTLFKVTPELCTKRLLQIYNRTLNNDYRKQVVCAERMGGYESSRL